MKTMVASLDKIMNLCLRRGLVFPSAELYGTFAGFFEYAGYGVEMRKRLEALWWKRFVQDREDVVGIDGALLLPAKVFRASGHLENFTDPLVECKKCKSRFRVDQLVADELRLEVDGLSEEKLNELVKKHKLVCEKCKGELGDAKRFNLMFETHAGSGLDEASRVFLRPETAQNIFIAFKQVFATSRKKIPFGIAQIGKSFRNEISPRNFLFRTREFTQMELEYFVHPDKKNDFSLSKEHEGVKLMVLTAKMQEKKEKPKEFTVKHLLDEKVIHSRVMAYWIAEFALFFESLGLTKLRLRQHVPTELSHYSAETFDFEYEFAETGWKELMGVADRTDFDLEAHGVASKKEQSIFDEESKQKIVPHVIEPSLGADRLFLALLVEAFEEKTEGGEVKNVLHLPAIVAPVQVAVFPLMKKDGLDAKARKVFESLREKFVCEYDESGSIGKRYARMDEIGCAYCLTIDYDSLEKEDATIRDRDSTKQKRVKIKDLEKELAGLLSGKAF